METLLQDIRFGLRQLFKRPIFTALAIISMALGIGANTAIFSLVDTVLLRPLPVREPSQLIAILRHAAQRRRLHPAIVPELQRLSRSQPLLRRNARLSLCRRESEPQRRERTRLGLRCFRKLLRRPRRKAGARPRVFAGGRSDAGFASGCCVELRLLAKTIRRRSAQSSGELFLSTIIRSLSSASRRKVLSAPKSRMRRNFSCR